MFCTVGHMREGSEHVCTEANGCQNHQWQKSESLVSVESEDVLFEEFVVDWTPQAGTTAEHDPGTEALRPVAIAEVLRSRDALSGSWKLVQQEGVEAFLEALGLGRTKNKVLTSMSLAVGKEVHTFAFSGNLLKFSGGSQGWELRVDGTSQSLAQGGDEARPEWDGATFVMTLQGVETRRSVHGDTLTMSMIARSPRRRGVATRVFARI